MEQYTLGLERGLTEPRTRWTVEFLIASAWSALEREKTNPALAERRCLQALSLLVHAFEDLLGSIRCFAHGDQLGL